METPRPDRRVPGAAGVSPCPQDAVPPSPSGGLHPPAAAAPAPTCRPQVAGGGAVHAGAGSSWGGEGQRGRAWAEAGGMDKLKRVLSGRDAEEPSGLSEVTLRSPAPASFLVTGGRVPGPGRQLLSGSWRERSEGPGAAPQRRRGPFARVGRRRDWAAPLRSVAGPLAPWGGAGRSGGLSGAGLWTFHLTVF